MTIRKMRITLHHLQCFVTQHFGYLEHRRAVHCNVRSVRVLGCFLILLEYVPSPFDDFRRTIWPIRHSRFDNRKVRQEVAPLGNPKIFSVPARKELSAGSLDRNGTQMVYGPKIRFCFRKGLLLRADQLPHSAPDSNRRRRLKLWLRGANLIRDLHPGPRQRPARHRDNSEGISR